MIPIGVPSASGCNREQQPFELARGGDQRQHDAGLRVQPFGAERLCRLHDRPHLRNVDAGVSNAHPAATMAEHRILFFQHPRILGQELVQRRVE